MRIYNSIFNLAPYFDLKQVYNYLSLTMLTAVSAQNMPWMAAQAQARFEAFRASAQQGFIQEMTRKKE